MLINILFPCYVELFRFSHWETRSSLTFHYHFQHRSIPSFHSIIPYFSHWETRSSLKLKYHSIPSFHHSIFQRQPTTVTQKHVKQVEKLHSSDPAGFKSHRFSQESITLFVVGRPLFRHSVARWDSGTANQILTHLAPMQPKWISKASDYIITRRVPGLVAVHLSFSYHPIKFIFALYLQ